MAENVIKTQRRVEVMGEDIFKIVNKLLGDQTLLKLVKYTDSDPLSHPDVPQDEIDKMLHKNILITPKIPDEDQDKNCYIIVLLDNYMVDPQNEDFKIATVRFDVLCPMDRWVINAKSLRPYLIMNEIDKNFNAASYFNECFGVAPNFDTPLKAVVIRAYNTEQYYMRDLPVHPTQRLIAEGDGYCDYEVTLRPTEDFLGYLLSRAHWVEIISPQEVRDHINRMVNNIKNRYK